MNLFSTPYRKHVLSFFIPALLWGDIFDAQADTQRSYIPTKAMQRIVEQNRLNEARIRAIRNQQLKQQDLSKQKPKVQTVMQAPLKSDGKQSIHSSIRYIWYQNRRFVLVQDIVKYYGMTLTYTKTGAILRSKRDVVQLIFEKRIASLNNTNMYLTHAPLLRGSLIYIDQNDFLLVIDPVIRNTPLWKHRLLTIMVDAGHGGKDKGAPGVGGLLEKDLNLAMAKKLADRFRKMGFRVLMTRTKDTLLSLQQRAELCEKYKPDLFLSVHCNAVGNMKTHGIETFAMTPHGSASSSDKKAVSNTGPGNSFDKNNYRLAYEIQKSLVLFTKAEDRGVKHARFFVLRNAVCPAVLVETGFITHPQEGKQLAQAAHQEKIISGIISGVSAYARAAAIAQNK